MLAIGSLGEGGTMGRGKTGKNPSGVPPPKTIAPQMEPHLPRPHKDAARAGGESFVEQLDASVARRVEALVDMLAWVRIEMAASHPDGAAVPSDHERLQRALVQIEMALAMTRQLATELRRRRQSTQED
jgi:hypothetical protein